MLITSPLLLACLLSASTDALSEIAKLLPLDGTSGDKFGSPMAMDGNLLLVGALADNPNGPNSGSVYLFDTSTGSQLAKLVPNDGAPFDTFGFRVAVEGTTALVSAIKDDDNGMDSGSVYVFDTTTGAQTAKLLPSDGAPGDNFGSSLAIHGSTALIGAIADDDQGFDSGSAYLFDLTSGLQIAKLSPADGMPGDLFGSSAALDDTCIVIGARRDTSAGVQSGSAYVFDTTTLLQTAKLIPADAVGSEDFGATLDLDQGTVILGAIGRDDNGIDSGACYLFDTGTGLQTAKLLPDDGAALDFFGWSVALHGNLIIVGARLDDDLGVNSGSAYLFDLAGSQLAKLQPSDGRTGDSFGYAVAIQATSIAVGAIDNDDNGPDSGSAYLFDVPALASATQRNGSGTNAQIFTSISAPVLGGPWITQLDCTGHAPGSAFLQISASPASGDFISGGELLINLASPTLLALFQPHTGTPIQFSLSVPFDTALLGATGSAQAVVFGAPAYELSNALDLVVGL